MAFGKILKNIRIKISSDPIFSLLVLLVIILAVFFRTYNYTNRVSIQADNAREIQVARYAFDHWKIPQVGPFSSAGPFFYSPWWYWSLAAVSIVPLGFLTHWYFMSMISLISIYLVFLIGREIGGKWLGATAALYGAISTAAINNSFSVWGPAIVPFLTALSLVLLIRISKTKRFLDVFLLGLTVALSITIHFQSILLIPTLIIAVFLVFLKRPKFFLVLKYLGLAASGFIIPIIPLVYFDMHHNWYNFASLTIFALVDQYRIWVPNRWLTYIGAYWPETWGQIIGGSWIAGTAIIGVLAVIGVLRLKSFAKYRAFYLVAFAFLSEVILLRYYRGERFYYYSLFAHPAVIILSAFVTHELFKVKKVLGIALGLVIVGLTLFKSTADLKNGQVTLSMINQVKTEIYSAYRLDNFDIYRCIYNGDRVGYPLALSIYLDKRNSPEGVKVGVCEMPDKSIQWHELANVEYTIQNPAYLNTTTEKVYKDVAEWFLKKPPGGQGDFWKFILENWRFGHS